MAETLRSQIDQVGACLIVALSGDLDTSTAPAARLAVLKCLADQPDAILVDLSAVTVVRTTALTVFLALARRAGVWPGIPILLCAPAPATARLLDTGGYGRLPVYASTAAALADLPERQAFSLYETLLPVRGAARRSRMLTEDACSRWHLPQLIRPAGIVADAFVSQAIEHASTLIDVRLALRRRYLMIAAHAGNPGAAPPPVPFPELGSLVLDSISRRWGHHPVEGGWVAWAMLNTDPGEINTDPGE